MQMNTQRTLQVGQHTLLEEANALTQTAKNLGEEFQSAVELIFKTPGKVVVTGLGKSGHIARKIASTFSSTGTPAFFLHPTEALHGDLGMIQSTDVLLAVAFGGETEEVLSVVRHANRIGILVVAITGRLESTLAKMAKIILNGSVEKEVCPHNLAPTSSTTVAMALGDALAMALMNAREFSSEDFAKFHPSGALGRRLMIVQELMKVADGDLPIVHKNSTFHQILEAVTKKNYGIVPVVNEQLHLEGVISDGDIRRILLANGAAALGLKASDLMNKSPKVIKSSALAIDAFQRMEQAQITSLFVVNDQLPCKLIGLLRMHDLLAAKIV